VCLPFWSFTERMENDCKLYINQTLNESGFDWLNTKRFNLKYSDDSVIDIKVYIKSIYFVGLLLLLFLIKTFF
jgi:hypothetical protein